MTLVNDCGIEERPDAFSARTEEYALQRRVYLYSRSDTATEPLQQFLQYATSQNADPLVAKAGFIGLGIVNRSQSADSARAEALRQVTDRYEREFADRMLDQLGEFDRLSTTFRFRNASSQLEERGQLDLQRLVDYLAENGPDSEIVFVGFMDDVGSFQGNLSLSENRAAQVLEEVRAVVGDRLPGVKMSSVGLRQPAAISTMKVAVSIAGSRFGSNPQPKRLLRRRKARGQTGRPHQKSKEFR